MTIIIAGKNHSCRYGVAPSAAGSPSAPTIGTVRPTGRNGFDAGIRPGAAPQPAHPGVTG